MKQRSRKEKFYVEVGQAMLMNDARCLINVETLVVEVHAPARFFELTEKEDTAQEFLNYPEKFFVLSEMNLSQSLKVMEVFTLALKDKNLQKKLIQALEGKKPTANWTSIINNSSLRQNWFDFREDGYAEIAKEWLEKNADKELKEKIQALPAVFLVE
ncbi:MAG: UPF0158 family protein [Chitinophagaceae bacterium]